MKRAILPVALAVALATGCSQIGNLDRFNGAVAQEPHAPEGGETPSDGAAGGIQEGDSAAEASMGPGDAADAADVGADSSTEEVADAADTGGPADATDSFDVSEGGPPNDWCAANSTATTALCRDFDDGKSYGYLFSSTNVNLVAGGAAPTIVSNVSLSPPSSLLLNMPLLGACAADGGANCSEQIQLTSNILSRTFVQVQFAIQLVNYDPNNVHDLSLFRVAYGNGQWAAEWDLQGFTSTVYESVIPPEGGVADTVQHKASLPSLGSWVNVVFAVDVAARAISLSFDGSVVFSDPSAAPAIVGPVSVTLGVNDLVGPATPLSLFLDDVLLTTQ
jgi:hypothetical protein